MSDGFLSRWSRRKAEMAAGKPQAEAAPPPAPPTEAEPAATAEPVIELPPIDSLTKDSDFSPFLRDGVPEDLRKAALARLWTSDPLFSKPEIYDLHMGDYSQPTVAEVVKTAWKVGKGMADQYANFTDIAENSHDKAPKDKDSPADG